MKLEYMIGFQEHDLELLKVISYHTVYPIWETEGLFAKSYDLKTSRYEGYQYGVYKKILDTENPFEGWESKLYKYWIINNCDLTLLHEAYTPSGKLIKKDVQVIWNDVPNLLNYYPNLEKLKIINDLISESVSYHINFQFYINGKISIEFFNGSKDYKLDKRSFVKYDLLTEMQYDYISQSIFDNLPYSLKFKWDNQGRIYQKFYVQDVNNWKWI